MAGRHFILLSSAETAVTGTLAVSLADLTTTATGTVGVTGTTSLTLADLTSHATGTAAIAGSVGVTLDAVTSTATGTGLITGTTSVTLAAVTLAAEGSVAALGLTGTLDQTCAPLTLTATGLVSDISPPIEPGLGGGGYVPVVRPYRRPRPVVERPVMVEGTAWLTLAPAVLQAQGRVQDFRASRPIVRMCRPGLPAMVLEGPADPEEEEELLLHVSD